MQLIHLKTCPAQVYTVQRFWAVRISHEQWEKKRKKNQHGRPKKGGNVKEKSFNGAGERAVRGTVVAQQMKIDTDN